MVERSPGGDRQGEVRPLPRTTVSVAGVSVIEKSFTYTRRTLVRVIAWGSP